jgi:hypothetical protein
MNALWEKAGGLWQAVSSLLGMRRARTPIDSVAALTDFLGTRSAYIAQKTLYGYVKTRMGIRYPAMFSDAKVVASLNIAKLQIFAACLSDLTVYAVAQALSGPGIGDAERRALALGCYRAALNTVVAAAPEQFSAAETVAAFERRLAVTAWHGSAGTADNFTASPQALFAWAPIADELKNLDREIIENSIKFAWPEVREQFLAHVDAAAIAGDPARPAAC